MPVTQRAGISSGFVRTITAVGDAGHSHVPELLLEEQQALFWRMVQAKRLQSGRE